MEQELAISCQKIAISWKPNWKSYVIDDALCLGLFGGGNLELPWGSLEFPCGRFTLNSHSVSILCMSFITEHFQLLKIGFQEMAIFWQEIPNSHSGN